MAEVQVGMRRGPLVVAVLAVLIAGVGGAPAAADDEWQDEVHLRPESVEALLSVDRSGDQHGSPAGSPTREIDTGEFRTVTVSHGEGGGQCQDPRAVRVTMTGTRSDGSEQTLVSQCEVSTVGADDARAAARRVASDAARLALPTAGFDPRVRGLVGLRTWLHVALPDQRLASAAVLGYDLRAVARPVAVEVVLDGVRQPIRLSPVPGAPADAVGPFVFHRSGLHHLSVRVVWIAEWVLFDPAGNAVRFGTISAVPGPTIGSDYPVVQAQARLR
jgi:hypothetical protein